MMILCPSCDTGFKLPDKHITAKGVKLRCSKCSHIFRVRRIEGQDDPEVFYKDEDRAKNKENGTSLDEASDGFGDLLSSDDAPSKQTHFGLAGFGAGTSGEIPVMGKGDGLGGLGDAIPAKPVIPGLEDESDGFGSALDADIVPGSGTMLGPASKPTAAAGGFGGGLDFGSLRRRRAPREVRHELWHASPHDRAAQEVRGRERQEGARPVGAAQAFPFGTSGHRARRPGRQGDLAPPR